MYGTEMSELDVCVKMKKKRKFSLELREQEQHIIQGHVSLLADDTKPILSGHTLASSMLS